MYALIMAIGCLCQKTVRKSRLIKTNEARPLLIFTCSPTAQTKKTALPYAERPLLSVVFRGKSGSVLLFGDQLFDLEQLQSRFLRRAVPFDHRVGIVCKLLAF